MKRDFIKSTWNFFFGDSARAFGSLSAILLALLAVVPAKDYFREWRGFQQRYLKLVANRGDGAALAKRFHGGVQQIWLPEIGVVDRCTTCHVALKEASLSDITTQPFRPHPPVHHSLEEFGCVTCHRGQGGATTVEEAHSSTKAWEQPLLPARYMEASCGQCHWKPLTGTPQLNQGRALLARSGCVNCHSINDPQGQPFEQTGNPPPLTHIAEKTKQTWIYAWLKNPTAYAASATMPDFQLKDDEVRDISAFLVAQSTPSLKAAKSLPTPAVPSGDAATAASQQGASVYGEAYCASCHAIQNAAGLLVGGNIGPELTRIGSKTNPDWIARWLRDPKSYDLKTLMPRYRVDEKDIGLITAFLGSKTDSDFIGNVNLPAVSADQIAHGKTLVIEKGCNACHEINGVKHADNFGPDLTEVGSRSLAKVPVIESVPHLLPDYLAAKIRKPRIFGEGLKMPQYTFTSGQVNALVIALLAQTSVASGLPASLRIAAAPRSTYAPGGKAGQLIDEMQCFSCHVMNGRGGPMAPELTWEGTAVQRAWLVDFLKKPNTLRPALIRRMPKFNMTDAEANTLADYIGASYQVPSSRDDDAEVARMSNGNPDHGKELFYGRYACQSCHIVDSAHDKGYVGPTLTAVGSRLTPLWMFRWVKHAGSLHPGTLEPNFDATDEDARDLVAFLAKQKAANAKEVAQR
jgi:mono/diheme cytochrome c family protein